MLCWLHEGGVGTRCFQYVATQHSTVALYYVGVRCVVVRVLSEEQSAAVGQSWK